MPNNLIEQLRFTCKELQSKNDAMIAKLEHVYVDMNNLHERLRNLEAKVQNLTYMIHPE